MKLVVSISSFIVAIIFTLFSVYGSYSSVDLFNFTPKNSCASLKGATLIYTHQDWNVLRCNRTVANMPIMVGGKIFTNGFGTHAFSTILFYRSPSQIAPGVFKVNIGMPDYLKDTPGSVVAIIRSDGLEKWNSGVIKPGTIKEASIELKDESFLELEVRDADDGINSDDVVWINPRIINQ